MYLETFQLMQEFIGHVSRNTSTYARIYKFKTLPTHARIYVYIDELQLMYEIEMYLEALKLMQKFIECIF